MLMAVFSGSENCGRDIGEVQDRAGPKWLCEVDRSRKQRVCHVMQTFEIEILLRKTTQISMREAL